MSQSARNMRRPNDRFIIPPNPRAPIHMHPMRPARDILASNTMRPMRAPADSVRRLAGRTLRVLRDTSGDGERVRRKRGRETAAGGVSFIDSDLAHVSDPEWRDWYLANGVRRKGNAYFCPFHEDRKSPSFGISGRGWTCFKENLHGDAVGFLVKRDGLSRDEAILELREEFNINTEKRAAAKANRVVAEHSYPDLEGASRRAISARSGCGSPSGQRHGRSAIRGDSRGGTGDESEKPARRALAESAGRRRSVGLLPAGRHGSRRLGGRREYARMEAA